MPKYSPTISPGQGLLLLIDHYKNDPTKVDRLKKLYLSGAEATADAEEIKELLKDPVLSSYKVSFEATTINEDATRRYFETHLAYESLTHGLSKIDHGELKAHADNLYAMIPADKKAGIEHVLNGEFRPKDNNLFKEYADYINKIRRGEMFPDLSAPEREKVELLVKSSFLGVVNAWYTPMPLNIYGTGIYSEKNKGKEIVKGQDATRNQNLGLMKGHMPLALDDIARSDKEIPYLKPSDQAAFVEHAQWVESNFGKMVHPFSNSISGTTLCQLRASAKLRDGGHGVFTDSGERMGQFSQLLVSAMLFNSGGHTLNEFTAPMALDSVRDEFRATPDFDKLNLESMYRTGNEEAFDAALKDTIQYNKNLLMRQALHAQIRGEMPVEPENAALKKLEEKQLAIHLDDMVTNESDRVNDLKDNYNNRVKGQFFSSFRVGADKNRLIQDGLQKAILHIKEAQLAKAQQVIANLKTTLVTNYGSTNLWGKKSESIRVVESVEAELKSIEEDVRSFKERLKVMKDPETAAAEDMQHDSADEREPDRCMKSTKNGGK